MAAYRGPEGQTETAPPQQITQKTNILKEAAKSVQEPLKTYKEFQKKHHIMNN